MMESCSFRPTPRWLPLLVVAALALWAAPARGQARAPYEYDPYRVVVWVAVEPSPQLPESLAEQLAQRLALEADQVFGAAWSVTGQACPATLARQVASQLDLVQAQQIRAIDSAVLDADKLFLVGCRADAGGAVRVGVRELDGRSRTFGEVVVRDASQPENLCGAALSALVEAFAPVVRIEMVTGNQSVTRLRAGGLLANDDPSPAAVKAGDLLQPVVRRNDRQGEPRPGGIQRLPYTFLEVTGREGHRVECTIHSGVRNAVSARGGRTERLALLVRPQTRGTRIVLRSRSNPPEELVDYEVLTRLPESTDPLAPLALTDREGAVYLPLAGAPLQLVYVRHGQQMLARVPIVPGLVAERTITLNNDDLRLLAESYYMAMQNNIMDLVARREVLAARIRLRIEKKELAEAQSMLTELRNFTSRSDLLQQVEEERSRYASDDKNVQAKVDKMFVELRKLLAKHLDPKLVDEVVSELEAAKKA